MLSEKLRRTLVLIQAQAKTETTRTASSSLANELNTASEKLACLRCSSSIWLTNYDQSKNKLFWHLGACEKQVAMPPADEDRVGLITLPTPFWCSAETSVEDKDEF